MRCKNCSAELHFENGIGVCNSCGSKFNFDHMFENNDACILSVNADERGARTRDSVIAKEIYSKLKSAKINTFFEDTVADTLFGDDSEQLKISALLNSNVVLLIGTTVENFDYLVEKYYDIIKDKKIVPVFCDVNPAKMPTEINKLQAIDYNAIGAEVDLTKGVLALLERENTLDFSELQKKSSNKKTIIWGVLVAVVVLMIGVGAFFTYHHFVSNKMDAEIELTPQQKYEMAQNYANDGLYVDAINTYIEIIDYKESKSLLKNVYDKFDGYYLSDDKGYSLHIDVQGTETATIEFSKNVSSTEKIYFEESCSIKGTIFTFNYTDNLSHTGNCTVKIQNDRVVVSIESQDLSPTSLGGVDQVFVLSNKTDEPTIEKITRQTVIDWLNNKISLGKLAQLGYEFEHHMTFTGYWLDDWAHVYKLKDQDLYAVFVNYDVQVAKDFSESLMDYWDWCAYGDGPDVPLKDPVAFAVVASGGILFPEQIGEPINSIDQSKAHISTNIDTNFYADFPSGVFRVKEQKSNIIKADMFFTITTDISTAGEVYTIH